MPFAILIIYAFLAIVLNFIYGFFCGGNPIIDPPKNFNGITGFFFGLCLPLFGIFLWYLKIISFDKNRGYYFLAILSWVLLPILLNLISLCVTRIGYTSTGLSVANYRYVALLFYPFLVLALWHTVWFYRRENQH